MISTQKISKKIRWGGEDDLLAVSGTGLPVFLSFGVYSGAGSEDETYHSEGLLGNSSYYMQEVR